MDRTFKLNLIAAICCISLVACDSKTPEELMASAQQHVALNDNDAAIIELKNAISQAPDLAQARLQIAHLYFKTGQAAAAEKELLRARDLGASDNDVLPLLAKVFFYSDQYEPVLTLAANDSLTDSDAKSSFALFQYIASVSSNLNELKLDAVKAKLNLNDEDKYIVEAYQAFLSRNFGLLDTVLERVSDTKSRQAEVALLNARYNQALNKHDIAASEFAKVNELVPIVNSINFLHVNALINADNLKEATKQVAVLSKVNKQHPVTNLFKANIAYRQENYEDSLAYSEIAIQNGSDTVTARIIGAVSAYKLKSMEKSYRHLINLNERENFKNGDIDRLLSLVQLNLGYAKEAASSLSSIDDLSEKDAFLLSSTGMELAKQGNLTTARNLLNTVQQLDSTNTDHKMRSAIIEMGGNEQTVIGNLKAVLALDDTSEEAWIQLALSHARAGNKAEAVKTAKEWGEKNAVSGLILEARVYLQLNQPSHAIQKLKEAKKLDRNNESIGRFILQAYERAADFNGLYSTAESILQETPYNTQAMLGLIKAGASLDKRNDVDKIFNNIIEQDPENEIPYVMLAISAKLNNDVNAGIEIIEKRKFSTNELGLMTLGDSYSELKDFESAEGVFELWAEKSPKSIMPLLRIIGIKSLQKDYEAALSLAEKSEAKFPHVRKFTVLKMVYQIELKNFNDAKTTLLELQKGETPQEALVSFYEGQVALNDRNFEKAESLFEAHYKLVPSFNVSMFWARALIALDRKFEAKKVLESQFQATAEPTTFMRHTMAEFYLQNNYYTRAASQYEALLKQQGESVLVLNNLAYVEQKSGMLDSARKHALRAVEIIPDNPTVLDTLGWIEFELNNLDEAFKHLFMASKLSPESNGITLHLAEVQIALGQTQQAQKLLRNMKQLTQSEMATRETLYSKIR